MLLNPRYVVKAKTPSETGLLSWIFGMLIGIYLYEFAFWVAIYFDFLVPYINLINFKLFCASRKSSVDVSYNVFNVTCIMKQHASESAVAM